MLAHRTYRKIEWAFWIVNRVLKHCRANTVKINFCTHTLMYSSLQIDKLCGVLWMKWIWPSVSHINTHFLYVAVCLLICVQTDNLVPAFPWPKCWPHRRVIIYQHDWMSIQLQNCERHFNQQSTRSSSLSRWVQDSGLSTVAVMAAHTVRRMKEMMRMKVPSRNDYLYLMNLI